MFMYPYTTYCCLCMMLPLYYVQTDFVFCWLRDVVLYFYERNNAGCVGCVVVRDTHSNHMFQKRKENLFGN